MAAHALVLGGSLSFSPSSALVAPTSRPFRVTSDLATLRTNGTSCSAAVRMDDVFMGSETPALREWLSQRAQIERGFLQRVFACDTLAMKAVTSAASRVTRTPAGARRRRGSRLPRRERR